MGHFVVEESNVEMFSALILKRLADLSMPFENRSYDTGANMKGKKAAQARLLLIESRPLFKTSGSGCDNLC